MRWMRRRGDRVIIISGAYEGQRGTVEANVYQKTVDDLDEWANGYHVMLDTDELVTVRYDTQPGKRKDPRNQPRVFIVPKFWYPGWASIP